jgi:hypothetical protein
MERKIVTEIVEFKILPDLSVKDFIAIVTHVEEAFHMQQRGYIDSELVNGKQNSWAMVMHWECMEDVKQASKRLMKDESTLHFREAIIPTSVRMLYFDQLKSWQLR